MPVVESGLFKGAKGMRPERKPTEGQQTEKGSDKLRLEIGRKGTRQGPVVWKWKSKQGKGKKGWKSKWGVDRKW